MYNSENLQEKWQPVLNHPDLPEIKDNYKKPVTSIILENQEKAMKEDAMLSYQKLAPVNSGFGGTNNNYDPILISLVRRSMPNLIAYDVCAVQPMTGSTGLIFAMKSNFDDYSRWYRRSLFNNQMSSFSNDDFLVVVKTLTSTAMTGTSSNGETNPAGTYITGGADYGSTNWWWYDYCSR